MNEERRLSVQEKIEVLEKSKVTLHPPIFDSRINMSTDRNSPDAESSSLETQKNTIRVVKTNEADSVQVEVSLGKTDEGDKMDTDVEKTDDEKDIETSKEAEQRETQVKESNSTLEKEVQGKEADRGEVQLQEGKGQVEKETERKEPEKEEHRGKIKTEIPLQEDQKTNTKSNEESSEKVKLVPLKDEEIDKIIDRYPRLKKDEKALQKHLDFFFSMDEMRYGYFTVHQLAYRLRSDGYYFSDAEIAVSIYIRY